jgi:hypothetical protein
MSPGTPSLLLPAFVRRLGDPSIRTVLLCGCGGGFDFVHALVPMHKGCHGNSRWS